MPTLIIINIIGTCIGTAIKNGFPLAINRNVNNTSYIPSTNGTCCLVNSLNDS